MDRAVIRIRYGSISSGLHGRAEDAARGTTVYLLPGLSSRQRRAALRRLRQEASRGCGPALPPGQLALALAVDRVRAAVGHALAVVRLHPAASLVPVLLIAGCTVLFALTSVTVRVTPRPAVNASGALPLTASRVPPAGGTRGARTPGSRSSRAGNRTGRGGGAESPAHPGTPGEPVSPEAKSLSLAVAPPASDSGTGSGAGPGGGSGTQPSSGVSVRASLPVAWVAAAVFPQSSPSVGVSPAGNSSSVVVCVSVGRLGGCLGA